MYEGTPEENKEEALEELAQVLDSIENHLHGLSLPVDNAIHVDVLRGLLITLKPQIKQAYFELGGKDVWSI